MKKRFLWLGLSFLLVASLVLASCAEAVPGEEEEEYLIGYTPLGYAMNAGRRATDAGVLKGVEENNGKLIYISPSLAGQSVGDAATQAAAFDTFITAGVDAIMVYPVDSLALVPSIQKATAAGIGVFFVLGSMPVEAEDDVDLIFTADNDYRYGSYMAAETMVDALIEKYGEPKGLVLELTGVMTMAVAQKRSGYFHEVIDEYPNIEVVAKEGYDDMAKCAVTVEDWFTAHPETDAIYMYTEFVYLAPTIEVLDKIGLWQKIGHPDHVIITGHDPNNVSLYCIRSGYVEMTYGTAIGIVSYAASTAMMDWVKTGHTPEIGDEYQTGIDGYEVAEILKDPTNAGLTLALLGFKVTQENANHPALFGNAQMEEPNGLTEPDTMDWW